MANTSGFSGNTYNNNKTSQSSGSSYTDLSLSVADAVKAARAMAESSKIYGPPPKDTNYGSTSPTGGGTVADAVKAARNTADNAGASGTTAPSSATTSTGTDPSQTNTNADGSTTPSLSEYEQQMDYDGDGEVSDAERDQFEREDASSYGQALKDQNRGGDAKRAEEAAYANQTFSQQSRSGGEMDEITYEDYYTGNDSTVDIEEQDDPSQDQPATTPSGRTIDDATLNSLIIGGGDEYDSSFDDIMYGEDSTVFGMPYKYSPFADPLCRMYQNTFEEDNNVVFINFGIPKINRSMFFKLSVTGEGGSSPLGSGITSIFGSKDPRLVSFSSAMRKFFQYASVTANYLWCMMDLPGSFKWNENLNSKWNSCGIPFYVTKNTSVSEGVSNEYSQASIIGDANQKAQETRQNYQMYGVFGGLVGGGNDSLLSNIKTNISEAFSSISGGIGAIGDIASAFFGKNKGAMQYYADLWSDSHADNSYQLNFKFTTPYGNKLDIFRNVYFPWALLWTASVPRQNGKYSYIEPFIVRIQFPGWFLIECGVIESMQWIKGGDNNLWSAENLPLEINVTLTVRDLYGVSMSSQKIGALRYNRALLGYLENMAGMTTTQLSIRSFGKRLKTEFKMRVGKLTDIVRMPKMAANDIYVNLAGRFFGG